MNIKLRTILALFGAISITLATAVAAVAPDGTVDTLYTTGSSVSPCQPETMKVSKIMLTSGKSGSTCTVTGKVTVLETAYPQQSVSGATVTITWSRPNANSVVKSATTDSNGIATFTTSGPSSTYTLTVNNVTKSAFTWDKSSSTLSKIIQN
ncbi:MAG TPA: hypothetical protein VK961_01745 [Chthoniobacter sp.]|nr:hypothetical protein [Chthoniobacter sp.]